MKPRGPRPFGYESLMPNLVKDVLLVASPYDRFILEEDGRFADRLLSQYVEMDLSAPPHFDHVPSAKTGPGEDGVRTLRLGSDHPPLLGYGPPRVGGSSAGLSPGDAGGDGHL